MAPAAAAPPPAQPQPAAASGSSFLSAAKAAATGPPREIKDEETASEDDGGPADLTRGPPCASREATPAAGWTEAALLNRKQNDYSHSSASFFPHVSSAAPQSDPYPGSLPLGCPNGSSASPSSGRRPTPSPWRSAGANSKRRNRRGRWRRGGPATARGLETKRGAARPGRGDDGCDEFPSPCVLERPACGCALRGVSFLQLRTASSGSNEEHHSTLPPSHRRRAPSPRPLRSQIWAICSRVLAESVVGQDLRPRDRWGARPLPLLLHFQPSPPPPLTRQHRRRTAVAHSYPLSAPEQPLLENGPNPPQPPPSRPDPKGPPVSLRETLPGKRR